MVGTIHQKCDAQLVNSLFKLWSPSAALVAPPTSFTRANFCAFISRGQSPYQFKKEEHESCGVRLSRANLGDVTKLFWSIVYLSQQPLGSKSTLMTSLVYRISFQTTLDYSIRKLARKPLSLSLEQRECN